MADDRANFMTAEVWNLVVGSLPLNTFVGDKPQKEVLEPVVRVGWHLEGYAKSAEALKCEDWHFQGCASNLLNLCCDYEHARESPLILSTFYSAQGRPDRHKMLYWSLPQAMSDLPKRKPGSGDFSCNSYVWPIEYYGLRNISGESLQCYDLADALDWSAWKSGAPSFRETVVTNACGKQPQDRVLLIPKGFPDKPFLLTGYRTPRGEIRDFSNGRLVILPMNALVSQDNTVPEPIKHWFAMLISPLNSRKSLEADFKSWLRCAKLSLMPIDRRGKSKKRESERQLKDLGVFRLLQRFTLPEAKAHVKKAGKPLPYLKDPDWYRSNSRAKKLLREKFGAKI